MQLRKESRQAAHVKIVSWVTCQLDCACVAFYRKVFNSLWVKRSEKQNEHKHWSIFPSKELNKNGWCFNMLKISIFKLNSSFFLLRRGQRLLRNAPHLPEENAKFPSSERDQLHQMTFFLASQDEQEINKLVFSRCYYGRFTYFINLFKSV